MLLLFRSHNLFPPHSANFFMILFIAFAVGGKSRSLYRKRRNFFDYYKRGKKQENPSKFNKKQEDERQAKLP
jgi:hypothetical protein